MHRHPSAHRGSYPVAPGIRTRPRGLNRRILVLGTLYLSLFGGSLLGVQAPSTALGVEKQGRGPAVILIPGLSCGGDVWDTTVAALQDRYELHVVTLPGFAGTAPLPRNTPFLETSRDLILEYIQTAGLVQPAIIGHSLGAHLAYQIAIEAPEVVGPIVAVDGLPFLGALRDPTATSESMAGAAAQIHTAFDSMTADQFVMQNEMALRTMIRDPKMIERVAETSGKSDPATVGKAMGELMVTDLRQQMAAIQAPVLQIGAFGGLPSEDMQRQMALGYQEQIAAAANTRFLAADTLHFVMLDDLDFFVEAVTHFLQESNR